MNLWLVKLLGPIRRLTLTIVRARVNSVIALGSGVHGRRFGRVGEESEDPEFDGSKVFR